MTPSMCQFLLNFIYTVHCDTCEPVDYFVDPPIYSKRVGVIFYFGPKGHRAELYRSFTFEMMTELKDDTESFGPFYFGRSVAGQINDYLKGRGTGC